MESADPVDAYDSWMHFADEHGISCMPGHTLNLPLWKRLLPKAVDANYISRKDADYVLHGLEFGFDLGLNEDLMPSRQYYRNYKSALENRGTVTDALRKRVGSGKTLKLGPWKQGDPFPSGVKGCVVPQGAVAKKLEPDAIRPTSDHSKTMLNSSVDMSQFAHTLDTYNEISAALGPGYYMRVEDVDGAFPILPLSSRVWKYMLVHWFDIDTPLDAQVAPNTMYMHAFADFGAAPSPGTWDVFFRCVKAMARAAGVLTLEMPHFVDDNSLIGPDRAYVDAQAERLADFLENLGISFKRLKSRKAATLQLVLGFWWDSVARTRTLEAHKLTLYLQHLREARNASYLTLHEMQVLSGRMQRAALTMPPRALVYLANLLSLTRGLSLPWHRRRVTAEVRKDLDMLISVLESNHGQGYFCYKHFGRAPAIFTDAAKDPRHAGGGYFSECGTYNLWKFGSRVKRDHIDSLEGRAVLRAVEELGPTLRHKVVPIYIDNTAFERSLHKGRSKAPRLNVILRQLFLLATRYECVFETHWISTHDNIAADALSRGDLERFTSYVGEHYPGGIHLARFASGLPGEGR